MPATSKTIQQPIIPSLKSFSDSIRLQDHESICWTLSYRLSRPTTLVDDEDDGEREERKKKRKQDEASRALVD